MSAIDKFIMRFTDDWRNPAGVAAVAAILFVMLLHWEQTRLIFRSLRRNPLRSVLTSMAIAVLVLVITLVGSVLAFLDAQTADKSHNLKALITERYQIPSRMPMAYADNLSRGAPRQKGDYIVDAAKDSMYWAFYGGLFDPNKKAREDMVFFFAMEPSKIMHVDEHGNYVTMMDDMDQLTDAEKHKLAADCLEMEKYPFKCLLGPKRLAQINKRVGEKFKIVSLNYKDIDLEFEILDVLPGSRYDMSAAMNYDYLDQALQHYNEGKSKDQQHAMTNTSLALMFLRVPDKPTFARVAEQVNNSPEFRSPAVKCETLSSGVASFIDTYKNILDFLRYYLIPAILGTIALVIANAISISVRERRVEMAVLKVLGFTPNQILLMVLSEALLIGTLSGLASAVATLWLVNHVFGGLSLPIAFFNKFMVDPAAPWWGLAIGAGAAFVGSVLPAWSARSVKVSEVFSKVA